MIPIRNMRSLRADPRTRTVYLNNAKVGCSTVKSNLWSLLSPDTLAQVGDVHSLKGSPFVNDLSALDWLQDARIFTFVRNPYERILSAYLNKINRRETAVWTGFARGFGIDPNDRLSFDGFIEILSGAVPETLNEHFRPQFMNILYPLVRPNFLGTLDQMDEMLPQILHRFTDHEVPPLQRRAGHGTDARSASRTHLNDPATNRRIAEIFAGDFDRFGFPEEPNVQVSHVLDTEISDHPHPALAATADMARAGSRAARAEALQTLLGGDLDTSDPALRAWMLHAQLDCAATEKDAMTLIRANMQTVLTGPDYLQRLAAKVAASRGAWPLVHRIATAARRP